MALINRLADPENERRYLHAERVARIPATRALKDVGDTEVYRPKMAYSA